MVVVVNVLTAIKLWPNVIYENFINVSITESSIVAIPWFISRSASARKFVNKQVISYW